MRKLLVILLVLALVFVAVGFYMDWFNVSTSRVGESGTTTIDLTIDKAKMKEDTDHAKQKVSDLATKSSPPTTRT